MQILRHFALLLTACWLAAAQPPVLAADGANAPIAAEAFLDDPELDPGTGTPLELGGADTDPFRVAAGELDLTGVEPGPHTLYLRFQDAAGLWSAPLGQSLNVTEGTPGNPLPGGNNILQAAEVFLDLDPGEGQGTPLAAADGGFDSSLEQARGLLALAGVAAGPHTLYVRFRDATGAWSAPLGQTLYVTGDDPIGSFPGGYNRIEAAEAFFDVDPGRGLGIPLNVALDGAIDSAIEALRGSADLSGLSSGIHVLHLRFLDSTGIWSPTTRQTLYVQSASDLGAFAGPVTLVAAEGAIDDGTPIPLAADDGAFDDMVETVSLVESVSDAYHSARIRFLDSAGLWSTDTTPSTQVLPNDTDWDGLPDDWERYWFGNLSQSGRDDPDGDGFTNFEELERGTNPLLADEGGALTISGLVRDGAGQSVANIAICVSGPVASNCNVQTDALGFYVLGAGGGLPAGDYLIEPQATAASGPYTFVPTSAQVTLGSAHVSGIDFVATYVADVTAPDTRITAGPAEGALVTASSVGFGWTGSDDRVGVLSFAYRLDDQPWSAYDTTTTATLADLSDGLHRFQVKARDAAGNEDPTPAERSFTVDATPPEPASAFRAAIADAGIRLDWTNSPSPDVALYRLYWNGGAGEIDYGTPLATIVHPTNAYVISGLTAEGTYGFGLRAADKAGNLELNTDVTAQVDVVGLSVSVALEHDTYDRGQDVPISGQVLSATGDPATNVAVAIAVRSSSTTRTFTAYTDVQGAFRYTFQPLAGEAGSYTVEARVQSNGLIQSASTGFRILGLWLQPASLSVDLSMNAARSVDLTLRNIGDIALTGLQYAVEDLDPADPLTASVDAGALPDRLEPGAQVTVPLLLVSAEGVAPSTPAQVRLSAQSTEGSIETAVISVTLADAVARPVIEPQPLKVGVPPGDSTTRALTVTNAGFAPIAAAELRLNAPAAYPWIQVLSGGLGSLAPQQAKEVQILISPPADLPLGVHVVQLDLAYDGKVQSAFVQVEIAATELGSLAVQVYDDTGSVVPQAEVSLISQVFYVNSLPDGTEQEYNNVIQGKTDAGGALLLSEVPAGDYRYVIQAPGHDPLQGEIRVEPGTEPQPLRAILVTNLVSVDFLVIPTTIQDQYDVTLQITYTTNLVKPTLYPYPERVGLSFFPEETESGVITIRNTSNYTAVRDLVMSAAGLDLTDNEVELVFSDGTKVTNLPELGPGETVQVPWTARFVGALPKLNSRLLGNITVSGKYTYSIDGQALEGTTTTPIPVTYSRPQDLRLPTIAYINDERDGNLCDLEYQDTTYRLNVTSNRDVLFDFDSELKAVSHINGGPDAASILAENTAFWTGIFNGPPPLTAKGDTVSFDIDGLEEALESRLCADREALLGHLRSVGFTGRWSDRAESDAYLIPISITTIRDDGISSSTCLSCGGGWPLPSVPTLQIPEGEVKIEIPQRIGLEREAFYVYLGLTPSVDQLDQVSVDLKVTDAEGTDRSAFFYEILTQQTGLADLAGSTVTEPVSLGWQLVPMSFAGGLLPEGETYEVSASISYVYQGNTYSYETVAVTITVLPMPRLTVDYSAPYVVMAGKAAKIRVRVTNNGYGPANGLTIASAQPQIVDNPNGVPITFTITGSSPTADSATFQPGEMTITFPTVAPGETVEGYWDLMTTRNGYFIEFDATFKHLSYLGVEIDPLIESVTTKLVPAIGGVVTQTGCGTLWLDGLIARLKLGTETIAESVVNSEGVYYLTDLPVGSGYHIDIDTPTGQTLLTLPDVTVLADQPIDIIESVVDVSGVDEDNNGVADCLCKDSGTLSGFLIDSTTGRPLSNVAVSAGGLTDLTDATGYYEIIGLACAIQEVTVNAPDFAAYDRTYDWSSGGWLSIRLTKESTVSGVDNNAGIVGDPVNTATGNYVYQRRDLEIPGIGIPFRFDRAYNSREASRPTATGTPLGYGWTHSYDARLVEGLDGIVTITWGDARTEAFTPDGAGGYTVQYGVFDTLTANGDGSFTLTKRDRGAYQFDTSGRLSRIDDKNGNSLTLVYAGAYLIEIQDTAGRSIRLDHDAFGRITLITDPIGRTVQYTYDGAGNLISAADPNGNLTQYTYDGSHQILTVVDPRGHTVVSNTYDDDRRVVTYQTDAKGNPTTYEYQALDRVTTVTDALGGVTLHHHDDRLWLIMEVDARGGTALYQYDDAGNRVAVTDKNGNVTRYDYDARGNVTRKTDALGQVTEITYDEQNNPLSRTDALGQVTAFAYDDRGNLIQTTDALGNVATIGYESRGLPIGITDPNGNLTTNAYDAEGNLIQVTDALGNVTRYAYDGVGRRLSVTDALGRVTAFAYDGNDNLLSVTDALGGVVTHTYDANDNKVSTTDRNGHTTTWAYDEKDLLISETDALGNTEIYSYDALDRRLSRTDRRGNTTGYAYDAVGNLVATTDALGNKTSLAYDLKGNRLSVTDARGSTTSLSYDTLDRPTRVVDALGNEVLTTYDALGRVTTVTVPGGRIVQNAYDALGRLTQVTDPEGGLSRFTYDANGNGLTQTDPNGNTTVLAYDALNRVVQVTDPNEHSIQTAYDAVSNRVSVTDALGHATQLAYDTLNRLVSQTDALGYTSTTAYDAGGRVIATTDAAGKTTALVYDGLDRLTQVTDAAGGTVRYAYDENGNRTAMTDPNGNVTTYAYDALNRRITMTEPLGHVTSLAYDAVGNLAQKTDPKGQVIGYAYDALNRLIGVDYPAQADVAFAYDGVGNLLTMTDGLGTTTHSYDLLDRRLSTIDPFGHVVGYGYDANGNRVSLTYPGDKTVTYTYDAANRMTTVTDWLGNVTAYSYDAADRLTGTLNSNGTTAAYGYDAADRLISLVNAKSDGTIINAYAYTLDAVGNHLSESRTEPLSPVLPPEIVTDTHDAENRLVESNSVGNTFDANGNMTAKGADTYGWDAADRLIETNIGGTVTQYGYDGLGNRYSRIRDGVETGFVLDTNTALTNVLMDTDGAGIPLAYNVFGQGLIARILPDDGVLQYHFDSRGSTIAVTDSTEAANQQYAYDPFGLVVNTGGTQGNPFGFLGRHGVFDEGDGLSFIRARYYNTKIGRFISKDPKDGHATLSQTYNKYAYALNSPQVLFDQTGFSAEQIDTNTTLDIRSSDSMNQAFLDGLLNELPSSCDSAWWDIRRNGCYSGPEWSMGLPRSAPSGLTPR
jgi:RHS repeat-associated protein